MAGFFRLITEYSIITDKNRKMTLKPKVVTVIGADVAVMVMSIVVGLVFWIPKDSNLITSPMVKGGLVNQVGINPKK